MGSARSHSIQKSELNVTLELARVPDKRIRAAAVTQGEDDLVFHRALKRGNEALIVMLRRACRELAPETDGMVAEFLEALEHGV